MTITQLQKLKTDIRAAISNNLPAEFLAELVAEHSELVEAVNQRLLLVTNLIINGYRDEAFQYAETSPQLLQAVSVLDFPETDKWKAVLVAHNLNQPPELMMEAASQLEDAYEEYKRLGPLLKKNRILAISKAPLESRIIVLRKLAKNDPLNPIWIDDCEMLQKVRLGQIKSEFQLAKNKNDVQKLDNLRNELTQPWQIPVPSSLKANVLDASTETLKQEAELNMKTVADQLNQCLAEFDEAKGRELRQQWNTLNQTAKLTPGVPLFEAAKEPLQWLAELDSEVAQDEEFQNSINHLEKSIDERVPLEVLDQRIYQAQKFEKELPDVLAHRVNQYRDSLLVAGSRKTWLRTIISVAVLAAIIAGTAWFLQDRGNANKIREATAAMKQFVDKEEFSAGAKYYASVDPFVKKAPDVISLHEQLSANEQTESNRLDRFNNLTSQFDLDGKLNAELDEQLKLAESIARFEEEKEAVKILDRKYEAEKNRRQNQRDEVVSAQLVPLRQQLLALQSENSLEAKKKIEVIISKINLLFSAKSRFIDGRTKLSGSLFSQGEQLINIGSSKISEIETSNTAAIELSTLKSGLRNYSKFSSSLSAFSRRFPSDPNTTEFRKSAEEQTLWSGLETLQRFASLQKKSNPDEVVGAEAQELKQQIDALPLSIADYSEFDTLVAHLLLQEKITTDLAGKKSELLSGLNSKDLKQATQMVQRSGGDRFFLAEPFDTSKTQFKYWKTGEKASSSKLLPGESVVAAGHLALIQELKADVRQHGTKGKCETLTLQLIKRVVQDGKSDPLVKCVLLEQILLYGYHTKSVLRPFCGDQLDALDDSDLTELKWRDYIRADPRQAQAKAFLTSLVAQAPSIISLIKTHRSETESMLKWIDSSLQISEPIGFLYRSASDWVFETISDLDDGTEVFYLISTGNKEAELESLGTTEGGRIEIKATAAPQAGRPIFILKQNDILKRSDSQ